MCIRDRLGSISKKRRHRDSATREPMSSANKRRQGDNQRLIWISYGICIVGAGRGPLEACLAHPSLLLALAATHPDPVWRWSLQAVLILALVRPVASPTAIGRRWLRLVAGGAAAACVLRRRHDAAGPGDGEACTAGRACWAWGCRSEASPQALHSGRELRAASTATSIATSI